ncbi:MAG: Co2+/Mg2+ efflux protein ApaG [Deltaproteobacteria bacterium]|nr:Co2+/Mg2+ efflux protein ApaG [Deltaproteobacteria bacterium]
MFRSEAVTQGIRVTVESRLEAEHSAPAERKWFFSYHVRIANEGDRVAQLVSRHWIITDASGEEREVRGPGVVGEQPVLEPGDAFEYTSGCPLRTPVGSMRGTYRMVAPDGAAFDAVIAPFRLGDLRSLN